MNDQQQNLELTEPSAEADAIREERDRIREEYRARLAEKLKEPEFRKIEGFPIGTDEAILALSDPPYYTACPNPFIEEWLAENAKPYDPATDDYHREPFAADVSEGKNDPIYNAHSYHTKVPHKAIMRYILHYTQPGDVVYDGFCGTGMTGVAAQMCGNQAQVESLGYKVCANGDVLDEAGSPVSRLGARKAVLNDLSPAATFISYNYNTSRDARAFEREARHSLNTVEVEFGWMYSTLHDASPAETERIALAVRQCTSAKEVRALYDELQATHCSLRDPDSKLRVGRVNYTIWSDVFSCPSCGGEIVFWNAAIDVAAGEVLNSFHCPSCRTEATKTQCDRIRRTFYDDATGLTTTQAKQVIALINYSIGKKRLEKKADANDLALTERIDGLPLPHWFPTAEMPEGYNTEQPRRSHGLTHTHHFYTRRNLAAFSALWDAGSGFAVMAALLGGFSVGLKLSRFRAALWFDKTSGPMKGMTSGTLYVPSLVGEQNWFSIFGERIAAVNRQLSKMDVAITSAATIITSGAAGRTNLPPNCIQYIFTDPPFGGNLMYSELNFINEAWLRVKTDAIPEAITNDKVGKRLSDYQALMTHSFSDYHRVLKPGHWMTVEFHNSANAVWNAIQEGLEKVGFVVADVRVIDKKQGTFKQVTSSGAVKQDLIISCYKPRHEFEERFKVVQGKPEGVIEFVREHLAMLPVAPVNKAGRLETVAERTRFLLFDRMVAYHLQHRARIPLSAADFYRLLDEQFIERDDMYFLPEQAARYDAVKSRGVETEQLSIFVRDEKTAVQWVRSRLTEQAQTLGDLTPQFMQELREWDTHEPRPELRDLLKEYFVETDGVWRVPDPNNEKDLEAMRSNALLRLFREYTSAKAPLKVFRKEAVLEGFRHCWETKQFGVIVAVCEKIPEKILQDIQEFVMMYDVAKDLAPTEQPQTAFVWE